MPKTIVITGTAAGMGRATVGKFATEGWNVVATVRKESDLEAHAALRCVKSLLLGVDDEGASAVRYYSAPDSASIPSSKQILGLDGYWREFRRAVLGHPSDLWKALTGKPGSTPVDMEV